MSNIIRNNKSRQMMMRILLKQKQKKNIFRNSLKKNDDKFVGLFYGVGNNIKNNSNSKDIFKRNFISPRAIGLGNLNKPNPLGRWSVDKEKYEQDSVVDWANHDHCGSESCTLEKEIKEVKDWEKFIENEKKEKEGVKYFSKDDYIQNYMTAFII